MITLSQLSAFTLLVLLHSFSPVEKKIYQTDNLIIHFTIEKSGVTMECLKGCSWEKLGLDRTVKGPQFVGQNGMLKSAEELREVRVGLVDFVFSVEKNEEGLSFAGYEGVRWESASAYCKRFIGECVIQLTENGVGTR